MYTGKAISLSPYFKKRGKPLKPEKVWDLYWKETYSYKGDYDVLTIGIFRQIKSILHSLSDKKFLECGSGTGKISALIAKHNGKVFLMDYSKKALEISRDFFKREKLDGVFEEGNIFNIPYQENEFDVVWSSGVLEHFSDTQQTQILAEMSRVCKKSGLLILFNPFAKAYIYRLGKYFAEKRGKWPFGDEFPVKSMKKQAEKLDITLINEYSFGFNTQLNFLPYVPLGGYIKRLFKFILSERLGSFIFNGYLLATVFKKN
jgi:ubiquinone/menaquinone biosynthesis C-methylase UbiE